MSNRIVCDFETTQITEDNPIPNIYLWGCIQVKNNQYAAGTSLGQFFKYIMSFKSSKIVYFHNGGKFDFRFLLKMFVLKKGKDYFFNQIFFPQKKVLVKVKECKYKTKNTLEKSRYLRHREYLILTNDSKQIIQIKIGLKNYKYRTKINQTITFRDSIQLFPRSSVANMGEQLGFPKFDFKGFLDIYNVEEDLISFMKKVPNAKDHLEYLKRDVLILNIFLNEVEKTFPMKKWKSTIASTAYNYFIMNSFCTYKIIKDKRIVVKGCLWKLWEERTRCKITPYELTEKGGNFFNFRINKSKKMVKHKSIAKKVFKDLFNSAFLSIELQTNTYQSEYIKRWYKGGLTFVNPKYQGVYLKNVNLKYVDINSSYPSVMKNKLLPIGDPVDKEIKGKRYLYLYEVKTLTKLVNEKGLPFLGVKKGYTPSEHTMCYEKIIPKGEVFYLTCYEYNLLKKYYKGKIKAEKKYTFEAIEGDRIFGDYIEYFMTIKNTTKNSIERYWSKIMLNALYGKFGEKALRDSKIFNPTINSLWENESLLLESTKYAPLSFFITAYARGYLIEGVGKNFEQTLYGDTDSLVINGSKLNFFKNIKIGKELGEWDIEYDNITEGIFRKAKQYYFKYDKGIKTHLAFAGYNLDHIESLSENILINGGGIDKQLRPNRDILIGIWLEEIEKDLHPVYRENYATNEDCWYHVKKTSSNKKKHQQLVSAKFKDNYDSQLSKSQRCLSKDSVKVDNFSSK